MLTREDIYIKENINKLKINSLFFSGGTIDNLNDFKKINILLSMKEDENKRIFFFAPMFFKIYNNEIKIVFNNKIVVKKLLHSFEYFYKIQKTQIKSTDINNVLNSETWSRIFAEKTAKFYFKYDFEKLRNKSKSM